MRSKWWFFFEVFAALVLGGCGCFQPVSEGQCATAAECSSGYRCLAGVCVPSASHLDGGAGGGDGGLLQPDGGCGGCVAFDGSCAPGTSDSFCGSFGFACGSCDPHSSCVEHKCRPDPGCNPGNCDGGCCQGTVCVATAEQTSQQCGASGAACAGCPPDQHCGFGVCTPLACGAQTCGTCCQNGDCLSTSSLSASACGANGAACSACPAEARCIGGACIVPACNPSSCASGCCANDVCSPAPSHDACGTGASACIACGSGQRCASGGCKTNGAGDPCTSDLECSALGSSAYCKKFTSSMNGEYPGGFCTRPCGRFNPDAGGCGPGAVCLDSLQAWGEDDAFCSPGCTSKPQCRVPDYDCYYVNRAGTTACWLKPLPGEDGGSELDGGP